MHCECKEATKNKISSSFTSEWFSLSPEKPVLGCKSPLDMKDGSEERGGEG